MNVVLIIPRRYGVHSGHTTTWGYGEPPMHECAVSLVVDLRTCPDPGLAAMLLPIPDTRVRPGHVWSHPDGLQAWTPDMPLDWLAAASPDVFGRLAEGMGATVIRPREVMAA